MIKKQADLLVWTMETIGQQGNTCSHHGIDVVDKWKLTKVDAETFSSLLQTN